MNHENLLLVCLFCLYAQRIASSQADFAVRAPAAAGADAGRVRSQWLADNVAAAARSW